MAGQPLLNTYGRLPIAFDHAQGVWMQDTQGQRYFDTFSGIAVTGLGHVHPRVTKALQQQAERIVHCSNLFHNTQQTQLARRLCELSDMEGVFLCNSGAEANEAAIKLARLHGRKREIQQPAIIVMDRAFHGRTLATLSATGSRKVQAGFEPLVTGFVRVPFNDLAAIESVARSNPNVVAVLVEPIQGEGGVCMPSDGYLEGLRAICDRQEWLLMLDEVQTGNGRTGRYFAYQHHNLLPDVVTTAKGLGNGFPIGACLARGEAAKLFHPGHHGSTFGGNPLGCAAALAVIEALEEDNLFRRAHELGNFIQAELRDHLEGAEYIRSIRGKGLMIAIEMAEPCPELVPLAKTLGLLLNVTADRVIRLLPPLTMTDEEAHYLVEQLIRVIKLYAADDRERPRNRPA